VRSGLLDLCHEALSQDRLVCDLTLVATDRLIVSSPLHRRQRPVGSREHVVTEVQLETRRQAIDVRESSYCWPEGWITPKLVQHRELDDGHIARQLEALQRPERDCSRRIVVEDRDYTIDDAGGRERLLATDPP